MIMTLNQVGKLPLEEASKRLDECGWDFAAVVKQIKEEERRENIIMQYMVNMNVDYNQAKNALQQNGWDPEKAAKGGNIIKVNLVLVADAGATWIMSPEFDKNAEGITILEYLNRVKPLQAAGGKQLYYRLYREKQCNEAQHISFLELTTSITQLGIPANSSLYVKASEQPPY